MIDYSTSESFESVEDQMEISGEDPYWGANAYMAAPLYFMPGEIVNNGYEYVLAMFCVGKLQAYYRAYIRADAAGDAIIMLMMSQPANCRRSALYDDFGGAIDPPPPGLVYLSYGYVSDLCVMDAVEMRALSLVRG